MSPPDTEQRRMVLALRKQGLSQRGIAKALHVSDSLVWYYLSPTAWTKKRS